MTDIKFNTIVFVLFIFLMIGCSIFGFKEQNKRKNSESNYAIELKEKIDSIEYYKSKCESYNNIIEEYAACGDSLMFKLDSITSMNDSLSGQLYVALFKLERIKYYNQIAANGNNITFLRGWINRTLNDE